MSGSRTQDNVVVCRVEELPPGERRLVHLGRHTVGVFNVGGRYYAFMNRCPHAGAPLCLGRITGMVEARGPGYDVAWVRDGELLRCPWHAWEFELETGRSVSNPRVRAKTFPVRIEDGQLVIELRTVTDDDTGRQANEVR